MGPPIGSCNQLRMRARFTATPNAAHGIPAKYRCRMCKLPRMQMHGGQRAYAVLLAFIAAAILAGGYMLKPAPPKNQSKATSEFTTIQGEVSRLREIAQRNSLRNTSARFSAVANEAARHALLLTPGDRPGWMIDSNGTFITAVGNPELLRNLQVRQDGSSAGMNLVVWGAGLPFATARPASTPAIFPATSLPLSQANLGAWVLLVSFNADGGVVFSPGNFGGHTEKTCGIRRYPALQLNIPLDESSVGGGIFDFDGNMLGMVVRCDEGITAIPVDAVRAAAASEGESSAMLQLGFLAADIDSNWAIVLNKANGVVVTDVWHGWPAANAAVTPGDVITAVNGKPVQNVAGISALIDGAADVVLDIKRGGRTTRKVLARNQSAGSAGQILISPQPSGPELQQVPDSSNLAAAGFRPGDHILTVNGQPATPTNVAVILSSTGPEKPTIVVAQRGSRTFARPVAL